MSQGIQPVTKVLTITHKISQGIIDNTK